MPTLPQNFTFPPGSVVLASGPSGSGKTTLLPDLIDAAAGDRSVAPAPTFTDRPIIDALNGPPDETIERLSRIGLGDPLSWSRSYHQLSAGQQVRFRLAALFERPERTVVWDDAGSNLDDLTAKAVAWAAGREARRQNKTLIVLTTRPDLHDHLDPDLSIHLDWTAKTELRWSKERRLESPLLDDALYRRGDFHDWSALKHLHYAAGDPGTAHSYHVLTGPPPAGLGATDPAGSDPVWAVAILSYPDLHSAARNLATDDAYRIAGDRKAAQRLNREVLRLSRIVVTPELRSIGLASLLVAEILGRTTARYVECSTSMGRYTRFLQSNGFREVPQGNGPTDGALMDWADQVKVPSIVLLDPDAFTDFILTLSVRQQRTARRLIWHHYHHFVVHRRQRKAVPKCIPGPSHPGWPEALDLAARRLQDRPAFFIIGPINHGEPECPPRPATPPETTT